MTKTIFFILTLIAFGLHSQRALLVETYACKEEMTPNGDFQPLTEGKIDIFIQDTVLIRTLLPNPENGKINFELPFDNLYKIRYRYKGYLTASSLISTENIPAGAPSPLKYLCMMFMHKPSSNSDYSVLDLPLIKYEYNAKEKSFSHNREYYKIMSEALRTMMKLESKTKIENEQKLMLQRQEAEKVLAEKESQRQRQMRNYAFISILLLLLLLSAVFIALKRNIAQKRIISSKHLEIEKQKQIIEEKQKDIISSITYARRIQRSLLPTEKYIDKTLGRIADKKPGG